MIRKTFITFAAALLAVMLMGTNDARAFLIDGFGDTQLGTGLGAILLTGDGNSNTGTCDSVVAGTATVAECTSDNLSAPASIVVTDTDFTGTTVTRTLRAIISDDSGNTSLGVIVGVSGVGGKYSLGVNPDFTAEAFIDWSFSSDVDFSIFSALQIIIDIVSLDLVGIEIEFTLCDGGACGIATTGALAMSGSQIVAFNIGDMCTDVGNLGGSCSMINFASVHVLGVTDVDLQLDLVAIIPEPATLALFGIGLLGLGFMSRRRRPLNRA